MSEFDTAMLFVGELKSGEQLLWSGRPRQGLMLRPSDAFAIPFSLLWGGFAIFWELGALRGEEGLSCFSLFGVPFVLVGLYMIAGRFFVDAYQRSRTQYALTNERIIIISGVINRNVKSLSLKTLAEINLSEGRGGRGTITLGPSSPQSWGLGGGNVSFGQAKYGPPRLEGIEDARAVYERILRAQQAAMPQAQ